LNPDRFDPGNIPDEIFDSVPPLIGDLVYEHLGPDAPLDPLTVFLSVKHGGLAHQVVGYFMDIQKKKSVATQTKFFRAIWMIHRFREYMILPPLHYLAGFDTASVQAAGRLAGDDVGHEGAEPDDPEAGPSSAVVAGPDDTEAGPSSVVVAEDKLAGDDDGDD